MGNVGLKAPEFYGTESYFGKDILDFLELLFEGVFSPLQLLEQVFAAAFALEVLAVVIFLDIFYLLDFILVKVFHQVFFLTLFKSFQVEKCSKVTIATFDLNLVTSHFLYGLFL